MADKIDYEQKCKQLDILINLLEGENKRLREQRNSVTDSDTISRAKAIDEIKEIYEWHDNVTKERIIEHFKQLPPAQPAPSQVAADIARIVENGKDMRVIEAAQPTPDQNGDLWITVPDIDEVTCIYVQESKSKFCRIFYEER